MHDGERILEGGDSTFGVEKRRSGRFGGHRRQRAQRATGAAMLSRDAAADRCRRERIGKLDTGARLDLRPEPAMNETPLLGPEYAPTGVAPHHEHGITAVLVAIDGLLRNECQSFAVLLGQGTHRVDVAAAKAIANAVEPRPGAHQKRLSSGAYLHGLFKRGSTQPLPLTRQRLGSARLLRARLHRLESRRCRVAGSPRPCPDS